MAPDKKSTHKNAVRSRKMIKKAFAELLNEKALDKITVTDIVDRAGISRGTFYAHYLDVYDLYASIQANMLEAVDKGLNDIGIIASLDDPEALVTLGIGFMAKNKEYYKLFITSRRSEEIINRISLYVSNKFCDEIISKDLSKEDAAKLEFFIFYTMGGITNTVIRWLDGTLDISPADCIECICSFYLSSMPDELKTFVESNKEAER